MALPSSNSLATDILNLPPTTNATSGMANLVSAIGSFMNQVQGGSMGTIGIFALTQPIVVSMLSSLSPVSDNSWITGFANALEAGINTAIITPGTVTNPIWAGSGSLDVATLPLGSSTITTVALAKATLISGLANATATNNPPHPLSQSIADCTLEFIFTCIGLGPPPTLAPTPIPTTAE